MDKLKEEIKSAKILDLNSYKFKVFSFGERGQKLSYELMNEITKKLSKSITNNFENFDYILSPEPGGHLWGSLVASNLKKDINILRLHPSNEKGEIKVFRKTAYNNNQLFFNKFKKGDKVVLLDDIISSGSSLKSIIEMLVKQGIEIIGVQTILVRTNKYQEIERKYKIPIKFLEKENDFEDIYSKPLNAPWSFSQIPQEIKELFSKKILKKGMNVLEIGCGEGHQSIFLAKQGLKVKAIDSSKNAIQFAKDNAKKEKVKVDFEINSYNNLNSIKVKYDFIFDWRFLHEIRNEQKRMNYLKSISHLLNPDGKYLSVSFTGDSEFMGNGKLRVSPAGIKIYFAKLNDLEKQFSKYFNILKSKHIFVPQKPNLKIKTNYILARKK